MARNAAVIPHYSHDLKKLALHRYFVAIAVSIFFVVNTYPLVVLTGMFHSFSEYPKTGVNYYQPLCISLVATLLYAICLRLSFRWQFWGPLLIATFLGFLLMLLSFVVFLRSG
jgi:hypothetical protein